MPPTAVFSWMPSTPLTLKSSLLKRSILCCIGLLAGKAKDLIASDLGGGNRFQRLGGKGTWLQERKSKGNLSDPFKRAKGVQGSALFEKEEESLSLKLGLL